ncbi:hypothetical protein MPSEU_000213000 [Mayamaea pseudoterrestris]|nr:hypothetical protein MPSEU_000213000 [Mayamaea pseudoterrestris]
MFVLLWLIACLSALDRVAMSVAILPMSMELGWTDTTKGAISSLFSVGYGLCIIPAGLVVSTSGRPIVILATGVLIWSIATMATPAAATATGTMLALLAARAAVGAGESVIIPSLQTLLIHWTTSQEKSRALAAVYSGFHVGTISAYIISPLIMAQVGWKGLFEVYGAMGLVVLIPWFMYAQDKPLAGFVSKPVLTRQPALLKQPLFEQISTTIQEVPWKEFLQSPGAWAMLLAHSAKNWGLYNSLAWTPTFFAESYHLDAHDSALFSVLPSILGAVGGVAAGTAADYFLGRASTDEICLAARRTNLRKIFQAIAFLGPALALGALACNIPEEPGLAQAFLMVSVGLQAGNVAGFEAGTQEKAGEKWAGLLYSLTSLPAVIVGTTGVYVTGRILDATGQDWSMVFALNACINVVGAIAFTILYDSKREFD